MSLRKRSRASTFLSATGQVGDPYAYQIGPIAAVDNSPTACPFRKSYPEAFVGQPGQDWDGGNDTRPLDPPTPGGILAQPQMRARLLVIRPLSNKNPSLSGLATCKPPSKIT